MFPTEVSHFHPSKVRIVFPHNMERIRIIRKKEIRRIRTGGQSTNRIFRGNRDGSWDQKWGISGSFMKAGSIINGNRK